MLDKKEDGGLKTAVKALRFFVRLAAKHKPSQLAVTLLYSLTKAGLPFVGVLLPKLVLDELSGARDPFRLLLYAVAAAGVSALCYLLSEWLRLRVERGGILLDSILDKLLGEKTCSMDYQYLEDPESLTILQRARQGRVTRGGMYAVMVWHLPNTLTNLFTCLGMLWVVAQTGLDELLAGYEKGVDTSVYKQFDEKGVEFSGGERQKIAIARALYKDAPIVVMDEPTAALDPIAEEEIYNQLNNLIHGRTALFISHRLSSCKFCDEVAVFQDGRVVEQGSHEDLMKEEGLYRRMFTAQSKYYV